MRLFIRIVHTITKAMHYTAGGLLLVIMAAVLLEIISRTLFSLTGGALDVTYQGGIEIVRYGLLFAVLLALPHSVHRGQVVVDLFTDGWSRRTRAIVEGLYSFGFGAMGFGMAGQFQAAIGRVALSGETTQDLLIPLSIIYAGITACAVMLGLRGVLGAFEQIRQGTVAQ